MQVVQPKWSGHLLAQDLCERLAGGALDNAPKKGAVGQAVVRHRRTRCPVRRGALKVASGRGEAWQVIRVQVAKLWQPRPVRQCVAHGDPTLAVRREVRPPPGEGRVVLEDAPFDEAMHDGGRHPLRHRESGEEGVAIDRASGRRVSDTCPRVDDDLAAVDGDHLQAGLTEGVYRFVKGVGGGGLGVWVHGGNPLGLSADGHAVRNSGIATRSKKRSASKAYPAPSGWRSSGNR